MSENVRLEYWSPIAMQELSPSLPAGHHRMGGICVESHRANQSISRDLRGSRKVLSVQPRLPSFHIFEGFSTPTRSPLQTLGGGGAS